MITIITCVLPLRNSTRISSASTIIHVLDESSWSDVRVESWAFIVGSPLSCRLNDQDPPCRFVFMMHFFAYSFFKFSSLSFVGDAIKSNPPPNRALIFLTTIAFWPVAFFDSLHMAAMTIRKILVALPPLRNVVCSLWYHQYFETINSIVARLRCCILENSFRSRIAQLL